MSVRRPRSSSESSDETNPRKRLSTRTRLKFPTTSDTTSSEGSPEDTEGISSIDDYQSSPEYSPHVVEEPEGSLGSLADLGSWASLASPKNIGSPGSPGSPGSVGSAATVSSDSSGLSLPEDVLDFYEDFFQGNTLRDLQIDDIVCAFEEGSRPYLFIRELGQGTFGSVYKAVKADTRDDPRNREEVAIKVIKPKTQGHVRSYERELHVIELLSNHPHDNISPFFEIFHSFDDQTHYFVSELSPIGDLYSALQEVNSTGALVWQPLLPQYCRHFIKGIAKGLQHLFRLNISHGDIKLENILVQWYSPEPGTVQDFTIHRYMRMVPKLTDFSGSEIGRPGEPILCDVPRCSPYSASPESYDPRVQQYDMKMADMYSIGACLLTMLLGCHVFQTPANVVNQNEVMTSIVNLKRNRNLINNVVRSFDYTLKQVLLRLIDPEPQNRITIEEFLSDQWFQQRLESQEAEQQWRNRFWKGPPQRTWGTRRQSAD